jgi:hypothetical protein
MARKFDVGRGLTLYEQHESTRIREGLVRFEPAAEPLRAELETGKFTVLVSKIPRVTKHTQLTFIYFFFSFSSMIVVKLKEPDTQNKKNSISRRMKNAFIVETKKGL